MIYKHDKKLRPYSGIVETAQPHFITMFREPDLDHQELCEVEQGKMQRKKIPDSAPRME